MLVTLGTLSTIFMLPFVLYELALGYSCKNLYIWPVILCTFAKLFGESSCFFIGKILEPKLKPSLSSYKVFKALEVLTKENPLKS